MSYGLARATTPIVPPSGSGFMRGFLHRGETGEGLDHERADGGEVVAALLHDDRGEAQAAEDPARFAVTRGADLERALGIAGCRVDAGCDDECARRGRELGCALHGCEPRDVGT